MDGHARNVSSIQLTEALVDASGNLLRAISCLDLIIQESSDRNGQVDTIASLLIRSRAMVMQSQMEIERQQKKGIL